MARLILDDEHFDEWVNAIIDKLTDKKKGLRALYHELRKRQAGQKKDMPRRLRDGYRPHSLGTFASRGGDPSDPTGELAADIADSGEPPDPLNQAIHTITQAVHNTLRTMEAAQSTALNTMPPAPKKEPGCVSCARHTDNNAEPYYSEIYSKAKGRELCRWCYDTAREHGDGDWPPLPLIVARARGDKISIQQVERAYDEVRTRR
jgi:hypothetical protein